MYNIVLIGLPGSGKSSLGKYMSEKMGKRFLDTDEMIESFTSKSIPDIFSTEGEERFRLYETQCVLEAAKAHSSIIATGGGIVLKEENMQALSKNGLIFFIDRSPDEILQSVNLDDRPLLQSDKQKIYDLYTARIHLYKKYAQYRIFNVHTVEEAYDFVLGILSVR